MLWIVVLGLVDIYILCWVMFLVDLKSKYGLIVEVL